LTRRLQPSTFDHASIDDAEKPYSLRQLMTRRVLLSVINYATLALVDIAYRATQPLFFSTPIGGGGLGLDPPSIGKILASFGALNGIFQVTCFARAHSLWGTKKLFVGGLCCAIPMFALFPVMNALARAYGVGPIVYSVVALQVVFSLGLSSCYGMTSCLLAMQYRRANLGFTGCIFIYISAASPNRASLGATNGIAQLLVSIVRAVGPATTTTLFSLSLAEGYMGGGLVYVVLLAVSLVVVTFGTTLPPEVWRS
jgi:hypothetical protein